MWHPRAPAFLIIPMYSTLFGNELKDTTLGCSQWVTSRWLVLGSGMFPVDLASIGGANMVSFIRGNQKSPERLENIYIEPHQQFRVGPNQHYGSLQQDKSPSCRHSSGQQSPLLALRPSFGSELWTGRSPILAPCVADKDTFTSGPARTTQVTAM